MKEGLSTLRINMAGLPEHFIILCDKGSKDLTPDKFSRFAYDNELRKMFPEGSSLSVQCHDDRIILIANGLKTCRLDSEKLWPGDSYQILDSGFYELTIGPMKFIVDVWIANHKRFIKGFTQPTLRNAFRIIGRSMLFWQ